MFWGKSNLGRSVLHRKDGGGPEDSVILKWNEPLYHKGPNDILCKLSFEKVDRKHIRVKVHRYDKDPGYQELSKALKEGLDRAGEEFNKTVPWADCPGIPFSA